MGSYHTCTCRYFVEINIIYMYIFTSYVCFTVFLTEKIEIHACMTRQNATLSKTPPICRPKNVRIFFNLKNVTLISVDISNNLHR